MWDVDEKLHTNYQEYSLLEILCCILRPRSKVLEKSIANTVF